MKIEKHIAVLAGDGIGPEVMTQTQRVLDVIAKKYGHAFHYVDAKIGGHAYEHTQSHCPTETLAICDKADAILLGSVGGPLDQQMLPKWKGCEINSILKLRKHFNFNINIRPIQVHVDLMEISPLKMEKIEQGIDFLIFRELTGGSYFGHHERAIKNNRRMAVDECVYDEQQIQSIARAAFEAARLRQKRVCSIDKANVLATSELWREVVNETAKDYPEVELTHLLVDNCVMQMIIHPCQFDVIVTENMFGDIISDLGASLVGSLGMMPSASLNADKKGLYESSGGSAPDIAGKGIANPSAQILSAAMLLRYSFGLEKEAAEIEKAIINTIKKGIMTTDLANGTKKSVSTALFVDDVITYL